MRSKLLARLVLPVCMMVLFACSGSDGGEGDSTDSPQETASVVEGGALRIATPESIPQLDPHQILFNIETSLYPLIWNGLTQYTQDGGTEIQPDLAESWEIEDDGQVWVFTLRDNLKFSDGQAITTDDIIFSIERALDPETGWYLTPYITNIERVSAPDDKTIRIELSGPSSTFGDDISRVKIVSEENLDVINETPLTTGPYKVEDFVPDDRLVLVRNDNFYGDPPVLDKISYETAQDPAAGVTALRTGEINAMWRAPWTDIAEFQSDPSSGVHVVVADQSPATSVMIQFDDESPPFDSIEARQAMMYAIDREKINEVVYAGNGLVGPTDSLIPPDDPWYNAEAMNYEFDLDKAKELFDQAGIDGDTKLTWWVASIFRDHVQMGQIVQQDLASIGINLDIQEQEVNTWAAKFYPPHKTYPGLVVPNFQTFSSPQILGFWFSEAAETNWGNKEYDRFVHAGDSVFDEQERLNNYGQAQALFSEEVPAIIVVKISNPIAAQNDVEGIWIDPEGYARFGEAHFVE